MYLKAYAKINLALNVISKRDDGYHDLDMVVLPIALHDTIVVSRKSKKKDNQVLINESPVEFSNNICGNLIDEIVKQYNIEKKYEFAIYKEIPMESGLGGGSSDAASIYHFYNKKFHIEKDEVETANFLKKFGSDIPFFIINKPSRVQGVGEVIEPIKIKNDYYVLIVKPHAGVSTKDVYERLDTNESKVANIDNVIKALESGDDDLLAQSIGNALEAPAIKLCPKIKEIKDYLIGNGLPITSMTGSGSAVFSLSTNRRKVEEIVIELKKLNYQAFYTTILKD